MRKLKILYLTTGLNVGGAEMLLYHMLATTDRERFAPSVISLGDSGRVGGLIESLGVPLSTLGMRPGRPTPAALLRLVSLVRTLQPDLIQGWMYHANLAGTLAAALTRSRTPVVWCVHKSVSSLKDEKRGTASVIRLCARLSGLTAKIVYVSEAGRVQHEAMGFRADKSLVISNGIDTSLFQPSAQARAALRSELGLPEETLLIGLSARYHPQKDHPNFLRAAALLGRSHPEAHFVLAGTNVNAQNPALHALVSELGLEQRVHLLGERGDMQAVTAALDIATSSSAFGEGLSLALAEAMASGVPCVVTDVGDSGTLVGATGRVVPARDAQALAGAWAELIDMGPAGRRALGRAARERVEERHGIGAMLRHYEQVHHEALGGAWAPEARRAEVPSV